MLKVIKIEYDNITKETGSAQIHDTENNLKIWLDFFTDINNETVFEWNKYIFFKNCIYDMQIKEYQDNIDNFMNCSELVREFINYNQQY